MLKKLVKRNWEKVSETETPVGESCGWFSVWCYCLLVVVGVVIVGAPTV